MNRTEKIIKWFSLPEKVDLREVTVIAELPEIRIVYLGTFDPLDLIYRNSIIRRAIFEDVEIKTL